MNHIKTRICIIGSGMGGGTLALLLGKMGYHPIVVEAGLSTPGCEKVNHISSGRDFGLATTRAIELGGTSNLWHGVVSPLDPVDFPGTGIDRNMSWPILYTDLCAYWEQAMQFFGFDKPEMQRLDSLPRAVRGRANDVEHDQRLFREKLFRVLVKPRRLKSDLLAEEAAGRLTILQNAVAHELIEDDARAGQISEVLVTQGLERVHIRAEQFILAAGALESPRILLNSKIWRRAGGANREHVGRFLLDHPMGFLGRLKFAGKRRAPLYSDLAEAGRNRLRLGLTAAEPMRYGNSNLYLRPALPGIPSRVESDILLSLIALRGVRSLRLHHLVKMVQYPGVTYRVIANRFALPIAYREADLFFVMEQTPFSESQVSLAKACDDFGYRIADVAWRVSGEDEARMTAYIEKVASAGLCSPSQTFREPPSAQRWRQIYTSAAHHLGTLRMARSPAYGVVDRNLKVFDLRNLWVCDGSVFPTGGNANPSLTICALAHRLAQHLGGKVLNA